MFQYLKDLNILGFIFWPSEKNIFSKKKLIESSYKDIIKYYIKKIDETKK